MNLKIDPVQLHTGLYRTGTLVHTHSPICNNQCLAWWRIAQAQCVKQILTDRNKAWVFCDVNWTS